MITAVKLMNISVPALECRSSVAAACSIESHVRPPLPPPPMPATTLSGLRGGGGEGTEGDSGCVGDT